MKKQYSWRKFFTDVHLWLGLSSGLILFIVCLTGTIYTFRSEIERAADPAKYKTIVNAQGKRLNLDELVSVVEKLVGGKSSSVFIPADASLNLQVGIRQTGKRVEGGEGASTYFVDPYTGKIAGKSGGGSSKFFTTVMQLHRWLLLDRAVGTMIVGIATSIFVIIIVSGLVIWLPKRIVNLKDGLRFKFSSNWKRINHDLHSVLGFYSMIVLLVMALTGLCWSFQWYRDGLGNMLGAKIFRGRNEKPIQSDATKDTTQVWPLSMQLAQAEAIFTYPGDLRITIPPTSAGAVAVSKSRSGFFAISAADKVQFDRYTGRQLKLERFSNKPFNEKIADSVRPLHTGEMYGIFSKIIYFITCLIATSLPVTGTIIWLNKMKRKSVFQRQKEDAPENARAAFLN